MRKILLLLLIITLSISSCNEPIGPQHMADPELIGWICRKCRYAFEEFDEYYHVCLYDSSISIDGFNPNGSLERTIIDYLIVTPFFDEDGFSENAIEHHYDIFERKYNKPDIESVMNNNWWISREERHRDSILVCNYSKAAELYHALLESYYSEYDSYVYDDVSVLNWLYDEDALADAYTGYLVEYEVGRGYYVLLSLTEYKQSNRYAVNIIYKGKSLSALHNCYE